MENRQLGYKIANTLNKSNHDIYYSVCKLMHDICELEVEYDIETGRLKKELTPEEQKLYDEYKASIDDCTYSDGEHPTLPEELIADKSIPDLFEKYNLYDFFGPVFNAEKVLDSAVKEAQIEYDYNWYAPHRTRMAIWLNQAKVVKLYYFIARVSIWAPWCDVARPARLPALYPCGLCYLW